MPNPIRIEKVTPQQFAAIHRELAKAEYSSERRVEEACKAGGIKPPTAFEDVELVVVYQTPPGAT